MKALPSYSVSSIIKSIQRGSITLTNDSKSSVYQANINEVDLNNTILLVEPDNEHLYDVYDSPTDSSYYIYPILSNNKIKLNRTTLSKTSSKTFNYTIIELNNKIIKSIQHGFSLNASTSSKSLAININKINTEKSIIILTTKLTGAIVRTFNGSGPTYGWWSINNFNESSFTINISSASCFYWQVIEFK